MPSSDSPQCATNLPENDDTRKNFLRHETNPQIHNGKPAAVVQLFQHLFAQKGYNERNQVSAGPSWQGAK
jgi:hypothetical protein